MKQKRKNWQQRLLFRLKDMNLRTSQGIMCVHLIWRKSLYVIMYMYLYMCDVCVVHITHMHIYMYNTHITCIFITKAHYFVEFLNEDESRKKLKKKVIK